MLMYFFQICNLTQITNSEYVKPCSAEKIVEASKEHFLKIANIANN